MMACGSAACSTNTSAWKTVHHLEYDLFLSIVCCTGCPPMGFGNSPFPCNAWRHLQNRSMQICRAPFAFFNGCCHTATTGSINKMDICIFFVGIRPHFENISSTITYNVPHWSSSWHPSHECVLSCLLSRAAKYLPSSLLSVNLPYLHKFKWS